MLAWLFGLAKKKDIESLNEKLAGDIAAIRQEIRGLQTNLAEEKQQRSKLEKIIGNAFLRGDFLRGIDFGEVIDRVVMEYVARLDYENQPLDAKIKKQLWLEREENKFEKS